MSCKKLLHDKTSPPLQSVIRLQETDKNKKKNKNKNKNKKKGKNENKIGSKYQKNQSVRGEAKILKSAEKSNNNSADLNDFVMIL